jgi:hypothetical protein
LLAWPSGSTIISAFILTKEAHFSFRAVLDNVNPTSEHELYLKLFITNGGGW